MGKRIVISTFGSFGDIHPYLAIALELKARGHRPLIATSEVYREKMDAAGIDFHAVRPDVPSYEQSPEIQALVEKLMDQKAGPEAIGDLILPHLRDIYSDLDAATKDADLLLTHPLPFVGTMIAEKKQLPCARRCADYKRWKTRFLTTITRKSERTYPSVSTMFWPTLDSRAAGTPRPFCPTRATWLDDTAEQSSCAQTLCASRKSFREPRARGTLR